MIKKILNKLLSRLSITLILIALQVSFLIMSLTKLGEKYIYVSMFMSFISVIVVFYLVCKNMNPAVKLAWIVPILLFPMLGGLLWLIYGRAVFSKEFKTNYLRAENSVVNSLKKEKECFLRLKDDNPEVANQSSYIYKYAKTPVYVNTDTKYYPSGEAFFESLIEELKKAKKFIFMEYFIIEEGKMWNTIFDILKEKVEEGVEVRVMYDDVGSIGKVPYKYCEKLKNAGIKTIVFNRVFPVLAIIFNYRDHRKITVIDGKVGFTGGANLADEYINEISRFGYWKDSAVKIEGEAVYSLTVMFLQMWNSMKHSEDDYSIYKYEFKKEEYYDGYVQPYKDEPLDKELVGEYVYMNIINSAKKYVYMYTPYLVIDNELKTALILAAKRGVDVRMVTPEKPDTRLVHYLSQSFYEELISAGVKIYQYTPGFIHSKCFLSDDNIATVGTINMDYRSLYHHFECGILFYKSSVCMELKEDMEKTFEVSEPVTKEWCRSKIIRFRLIGPILKLLAPMA